jgi:hypothetical protein
VELGRKISKETEDLPPLNFDIKGLGVFPTTIYAQAYEKSGNLELYRSAISKAVVAYLAVEAIARALVPGIAFVNMIRFKRYPSFVGTSLKRNTHLTKRGSPYLRRALYLAAAAAQRSDQELKATYDKKRAEGKQYREATIVVARRVITRVYAIWKRGTAYRPYQQRVA